MDRNNSNSNRDNNNSKMKKEKLSLIIPVYNEEKTLGEILGKVIKVRFPIKREIIVVDDCSQDNSLKIAKKFEKKYKEIKLIKHKKNKGKGAALRTGIKKATGTIIGIQDSDLEYNPEEIVYLIKPLLKNECKVVYGSRFINKYKYKKNKFYYGNRILSLITSILYMRKITDMETCYKFFRKEVLERIKLKSKRFDIEPEITAKIIKRGYKIKEIPISYKPRTEKQGKKIKTKDGLVAIYTLLGYRFIPKAKLV